jgi:hypothetical protein
LSRQVVAGSGELELRRASAGVSSLLLAMVTIAIAEAALGALLVLFSYVLRLGLVLDLGSTRVFFQPNPATYPPYVQPGPFIELYSPALVASMLFCAICGFGVAARTFRRWRPTE